MSVSKNIEALLVKYDINQEALARIAGVTPGAITGWKKGAMPHKDALDRVCKHFNISKDYILSDQHGLAAIMEDFGNGSLSHSVTRTVAPVYGTIAAGTPLEMIEDFDEAYVIPQIQEKYPDGFFLRVRGDSMNQIMPNGSLAYVDPKVEPKSGDVVAINVNGYDATIKRLFFAGDTIVLHPESNNSTHRDLSIDKNDPDAPSVRILGKVVWHYLENDNRL